MELSKMSLPMKAQFETAPFIYQMILLLTVAVPTPD